MPILLRKTGGGGGGSIFYFFFRSCSLPSMKGTSFDFVDFLRPPCFFPFFRLLLTISWLTFDCIVICKTEAKEELRKLSI